MSRRDTIILAVLVNAALLSILFFTATRPDASPSSRVVLSEQAVRSHVPTSLPIGGLAAPRAEMEERREPLVRAFGSIQSESIQPISAQQLFDDHISAPLALADEEPAAEDDEEYVEVVVKRGDFLEKIARANGASVGEIKKINQLSTDRIDIGQVLRVPASRRTTAPARPIARVETNETGSEYYVMKPGDNPWNIARQNHVNFEEFLRLNNLNEDRARNLKPGDKLRVR